MLFWRYGKDRQSSESDRNKIAESGKIERTEQYYGPAKVPFPGKSRTFAAEIYMEKVMKMKLVAMLTAACMLSVSVAYAQETPCKVSNVELLDLDGNPATLPYWGEKNLMIFYVDPDRHKQNEDFTIELEENHRAAGDNIYGFGVMNLKDAPMVPNGMARSMAKKRTAKNGATVLADQDRILSTAWGLGDCNNQFVLMLVSKKGELVFVRKGQLSEKDKEAFYKIIEKYR